MRQSVLIFAIFARAVSAPVCAEEQAIEIVVMPSVAEADQKLADISLFAAAITTAEKVTVLEGLPHAILESALYEQALRRTDLVWLHGFPFYTRPLDLSASDQNKLRATVLQPSAHLAFPPNAPPKLCGGFHPDFALVWTKGTATTEILICFGCEEWKSFSAETCIECDISKAASAELKVLLLPRATSRPSGTAVPAIEQSKSQ